MARSRAEWAPGGMPLVYGLAASARAEVAQAAVTQALATPQRHMQRVLTALLFGFVATAEGLVREPAASRISGSVRNLDRAVPVDGRHARGGHLATPVSSAGLFTQFALDLAGQHPGRTVAVLQAGCTTAAEELDLAALADRGFRLDVSLVDDESAASRAAVAARPELERARLAEFGRLALRPRSYDIVECSLLLHRVANAEMLLWRLAAAVRPGGLLLLRLPDPASASGFLDRRLPGFVRVLAWRSARPGQAGPYPAVYEPVASARGIELFMSRHGLAVAHRQLVRSTRSPTRPALARTAGQLVAWLSRGRLSADHDDLCYVIRRPEDRFARVLQ
jgi:SAM-dependent methyltransferase